MTNEADIIRACFRAFETKQREILEPLIAKDFTFTSPYDDHIDRAAYFKRCWPASEVITTVDLTAIAGKGDGWFVRYLATMTSGAIFRNVEYFKIRDGQVRSVEVYFGDPMNAPDDEAAAT